MPLMMMDPRAVTRERCPVARCVTSEENLMEKIHIERHEAEYRIDGLTLDEPTFKGLWQCIENFPVTTAVSKA
jgi:hypothetical protein